ncbi:hypothetical protein PIB30_078471, partial [Stylosanthes scabra]|nr:hypothetical protein [Stylosanthes scabra]
MLMIRAAHVSPSKVPSRRKRPFRRGCLPVPSPHLSSLLSATELSWPPHLPCQTVADGAVEGEATLISVLRRPALTKLRSPPSSSFAAPPRRRCVSAASRILNSQ